MAVAPRARRYHPVFLGTERGYCALARTLQGRPSDWLLIPPSRAVSAATFLHQRHGVTLIEMLISVTLTLMVVFAIVQVFDLLGDNVTNTRAIIEMSGQLRSVANQLQSDLDGITVPVRPPADPDGAPGYFEILEGWGSDKDPDGTNPGVAAQIQSSNAFNLDGTISEQLLPPGVDPSVGDIDDVLSLHNPQPWRAVCWPHRSRHNPAQKRP